MKLERLIDIIGLSLLALGTAMVLSSCSRHNAVAPHLAPDYGCKMEPCPPGSYCPQACQP